MSSYSFKSPKGLINYPPNDDDPKVKTKNHWIIKLCPHIIAIDSFVELIIHKGIMEVIMIAVIIWIGNNIQKDKFIIEGIFATMWIVLAIMNLQSLYVNIQILLQMDMYDIFPGIKEIIDLFAGIL